MNYLTVGGEVFRIDSKILGVFDEIIMHTSALVLGKALVLLEGPLGVFLGELMS